MTDGKTAQDEGQDAGVDIATAAIHLGISKEAVRKKIARGTLRAVKVAGLWRVVLPAVRDARSAASEASQDTIQAAAGIGAGHGQDALVCALQNEVGFLREQLRTRDQQIERMHVLLQAEQQQVKVLTDQRRQPPWWRRWFQC